ncbi:copper resistance protein CopC [Streptosporangium sp. NPDC001559]|uniref:copper resistance CopC family protein n=1 Tax=Streptosporangium sp. NPDC001559 TaxID=3366187 RepID=UPI0036EC7086
MSPSRERGPARLALCLCLALPVVVWLAAPASAHGVLVGSDPAGGTVLARAPRTATLTFDEVVAERLSYARLVDGSGRVLEDVTCSVDGTRLVLRLPGLPWGIYGIAWQVLTAGDGHKADGMVVFAVGPAPAGWARAPAALPADFARDPAVPGQNGRVAARGWARLCLLAGVVAVAALLRRVLVAGVRYPSGLVTGGRPDPAAATAACAAAVLLLGAALFTRQAGAPAVSGPAAPAASVTTTRGVVSGDLVVAISVTPNRAGTNGFTVTAASSRRPPPAPVDGVSLRSPAGLTPLRRLESGRYVGTGELGAASTRLTVVVTRGGEVQEIPVAWRLG